MPSPKKPSELETRINSIVARAAQEISAAVRLDLVGEIQKAIDSLVRHGLAPHPAVATKQVTPARRPASRPARSAKASKTVEGDHLPKSNGEHVTAQGAESGAAATLAAAAPFGTRKSAAAKRPKRSKPEAKKGGKRRLISEAELEVVLAVLKRSPGLTSIELQRQAAIDARQAARVLGKLRETELVKWEGERSAAKYTIA